MARATTIITFGLAAAAALATAPARAADLAEPAAAFAAPAAEPLLEWGSGWYLRGDIGYNEIRVGSAVVEGFVNRTLKKPEAKAIWAPSFGIGYKVNSFLRADATLEWRGSSGVTSKNYADMTVCAQWLWANLSGCDITATTDMRGFMGMANVYADLGDWNGVTPYVGFGVGAIRTRTNSTFASIYDRDNGSTTYLNANVLSGAGKTQLAWALMAGAAIAVDKNISIDLGYRYLNLGSTTTAPFVTQIWPNTPLVAKVKTNDIKAHEFRVGLRYMLDN